MMRSRVGKGALLFAALAASCQAEHRSTPPPGVTAGTGGDDLVDAGGPIGPPAADAGGLCGNELHAIVFDAPNLYFILDTSGSMATPAAGTSSTRYQLVRKAAFDLIRKLGPRINVGAAVFPLGATANDACHPGGEVMAMRPGDPAGNQIGPTSLAFEKATLLSPFGNTPTAATLAALLPTLTSQKGRTAAILATDGGPNCDASAMCSADECIPNIEGQCDPPAANCCAPNGPDGPTACLDRTPTVDAVAALAAAGVPVYVVGVPGSEVYSAVLDQMALAGGAPRFAPPFYYRVGDFADLDAVFAEIAEGQVSCSIDLADPPKDIGFTNVYFDQTLVPYDPVNGWVWQAPPSIVELRGDACEALKGGQVSTVQVVSGCPTQAPK